VLDIDPTHPLATTDAGSPVERTIDTRGWIRAADLHRLTGDTRPPTVGDWIASPSALAETRRRVLDAVDKAGAAGLALNRLSEHERAAVGCFEDVEINGGRVFRQDDDRLAEHLFLEELRAKPFTPPPPDSVKHDELAELVRRGLVLRCDGLYFAATAVELAAELIEPIVVASEGGVTVSEIRTQLGISRKYALALAQLLDREGFTRRNGSLRVAGHALRLRGSDESGDGNPEQPSSLRDPTDDRGRVPGT
jgi:selenocysteine-specific elongation factor